MYKRLIKADRNIARKLRKLMEKTKNNTERKRIEIVVQYMWWKTVDEVSKSMLVSNVTVLKAVHGYKEKGDEFYKTHWKWRQESEKYKKLAEQAKEIIESDENVDINEVRRRLEKLNWEEYGYEKIHWLVRRKMWYNYQKPFVTSNKQSEYAKEIAEWRLRKWLYEIALEEWGVDAKSVKNKKIKIWGAILSDVNTMSGWILVWDIAENVKSAL